VEEIESARARLEAADARIGQLAQQVKDAAILAPVAGIVTERLAEPGEVLAAGAAVALLVELDRPWLTVFIGEPDLGRLRLGQEVEVVTGSGDTRKGRVEFVSPQAEFTPKNVQTRDERAKLVFRVKVALPNEDGLFKPGMPAEARLRRTEG
jgi:HlyD family secretion protein